MKLIHLADLHLGKRVNGFSMIDDQKYILAQIVGIIDAEQPQVVLIAGDVYDRSIPSEDAVDLFDDFLVKLSQRGVEVYIISGNHDSAERVAFGGRLMDASGIHFAPVYNGEIAPLTLDDAYGTVTFWPIPFLKPVHVRHFYPDEPLESYADAMQFVVGRLPLDCANRNVALVHQFITGASTLGSEEQSVGGIDEIPVSVFDAFDYVALGHLHSPQKIGREGVRYAGSPLKYSFSEANQKKSVPVIELGAKGHIHIREIPLVARRDMRRISGSFKEIMAAAEQNEDYYEITLTDEEDISNAIDHLRLGYPNLMILRYDNTRTRTESIILAREDVEKKSPLELFDTLFTQQNGQPMNGEQRKYIGSLIEEIWEAQV